MAKKKAQKKVLKALPAQEEIPLKRTKIRVFGIGGGGCSIVSEIARRVKKATFVAANTDQKALKEAGRGAIHFHFGESLTGGLGTGMNAQTGELAALAEKDKIKKLCQGQDFCIFVACLGGGTGSGATKVFARIARSAGCMTYGIFTLPFNFEGEKKSQNAKAALEDLKGKMHAYSIIPNERVFQIIQKETPLRAALSAINGTLSQSLEGLIEIIYEPGLINIDFADLKAILQGQGRLTYLNSVRVSKKEGAVQEEIGKLLNSPLYPYGIKGAKSVLFNIAGEKGLTLSEVSQISKSISELANKEAKIIFGISQNQKYSGIIKTTLLATGCTTKVFSETRAVQKPQAKKREEKKDSRPSKKNVKAGGNKTKIETKTAKPAKKAQKKVKLKARQKKKRKASKKIKIQVFSPVPEAKPQELLRRNALQVQQEAKAAEAEMLAKERVWETPAFLRRKKIF